ncbi:ankyrin repeat-containing domain protein [Mycena capillaripes]|nr:ankyrin repeat-containing domain protein [Mycena capillaripes]
MADIIGILASILQLVDVVATAGIYVKDLRNAPTEQQKIYAEVQALRPLLGDLHSRISRERVATEATTLVQQLHEPLAQLEKILKHLTDKVDPARGDRLTRRVNWTLWDKKQVKVDLDEIERFKTLLTYWLGLNTWDISQNGEREKIIRWFSPLNFFPQQDDIFATRQEGTGEWLLNTDEFKEWKSGTGVTFWCYGMPGAGKTVLASLVVNHLSKEAEVQRQEFKAPSFGVACVYCNHKETSLQTPLNLISSLWRQLIYGQSISGYVRDLYDKHSERHTRPTMEEALAALRSVIAGYSKVFFVIDGLDECTADDGNARSILFTRLRSLGSAVNLILTSRPHIDVQAAFPRVLRLEIRANNHDIRQYVRGKILLSSRLAKHVNTKPDLRQEIENEIITLADGMFLMAKLHIETLQTKNTVTGVREALKNLPADLNHAYDAVLRRIDSQNEDDRYLANQVLLWISNAKRPLSVSELQEALAIEPGTSSLNADSLPRIDIILSVCGGLLTVDWSNRVFRLVHCTTQHYLERIRAGRFPDAQIVITAACLTYLSFKVFANPAQHHRYQTYNGYMFLPYAAKYGLVHAKGEPEFLLRDEILEFLGHASRWKLFSPHEYWPQSPSELWVAASFNLYGIATYLLARPRVLEDKKKAGDPLYVAASLGFLEMARLLLGNGADANVQGGVFGTALQAAAVGGHEALIRLFIEHGAHINTKTGFWGTALQAASVYGHETTVRILLENGADVNIQGGEFRTALHAASTSGYGKIVRLLVQHGATVNAQGGHWGTALHAASRRGVESSIKLLIEHGANVDEHNLFDNCTPLQVASSQGQAMAVRLLLENGADVNAQAGDNGTALQAASAMGHDAVVRVLLENGADVNACGGEFCYALWSAVAKGHKAVVRLLIEGGANLDAQGGPEPGMYGTSTALQAASASGNEEMVRLLVESGANVNIQEGKHGTALMAASFRGHTNIVRFLLSSEGMPRAMSSH